MAYEFNAADVKERLLAQWENWIVTSGTPRRYVIGMSGGKDSLIAAALAAIKVGPENVYGVLIPNGTQSDIADAERAVAATGIRCLRVNIGSAFEELVDGITYCGMGYDMSKDAKINLPPRLRTAVLFGIAQSVGGIVINTSNRTEDDLGYCTLGGDDMGGYAPIQDLTVTEVLKLGDYLGLPTDLVHKKPGDGLQELGDEDRLGVKYADVDVLIRTGVGTEELKDKVFAYYKKNKFKLDMIRLQGPKFGFPDYVRGSATPDGSFAD